MTIPYALRAGILFGVCMTSWLAAGAVAAQVSSAVGGPLTLAEGTVEQAADSTLVIKSAEGVSRLFKVASTAIAHGRTPRAYNDWFGSLKPGTSVFVHYSGSGDDATIHELAYVGTDGLQISEGTVIALNRGREEMTLRFAGGREERLKLTPRAVTDADAVADSGTVVVYYSDDNGAKTAHYFRRK